MDRITLNFKSVIQDSCRFADNEALIRFDADREYVRKRFKNKHMTNMACVEHLVIDPEKIKPEEYEATIAYFDDGDFALYFRKMEVENDRG